MKYLIETKTIVNNFVTSAILSKRTGLNLQYVPKHNSIYSCHFVETELSLDQLLSLLKSENIYHYSISIIGVETISPIKSLEVAIEQNNRSRQEKENELKKLIVELES